jgi:hypothetical protein
MTKKKRRRTLRRQLERSADKLAEARRKLLALEPGGSPAHPLEVASAAVIERRAESFACPDCRGALRVVRHDAEEHEGRLLRPVELACRDCGAPLTLYFRVAPALLN